MAEKRNIEELINSLKEHKDAVIIIGNQTTSEKIQKEDGSIEKKNFMFEPNEETCKIFSRKVMVKDPKQFWDYYNKEVLNNKTYMPESYEKIIQLIGTGLIKTVIDFNCDGILSNLKDSIEYIPIKGNRNILQCVKCNEYIDIDLVDFNNIENALLHSDCKNIDCKGKIRPSIPFFTDTYKQEYTSQMFKSIFKYNQEDTAIGLNTHNLILIGVDFEEDIVDELIEGFNRFKARDKSNTVFITDNEDIYMNAYFADFGTTYDLAESLDKLCNLL